MHRLSHCANWPLSKRMQRTYTPNTTPKHSERCRSSLEGLEDDALVYLCVSLEGAESIILQLGEEAADGLAKWDTSVSNVSHLVGNLAL